MKTINLEWFHLDVDGETCDRCDATGEEIRAAVQALAHECAPRGVTLTFRETRLPPSEIHRSNRIEIDGQPVESLLSHARAGASDCASCTSLVGEQTSCRTVIRFGEAFETVPQHLIREAVCARAACC